MAPSPRYPEQDGERKESSKANEEPRAEFEAKQREGHDSSVDAGRELARGILQGTGRKVAEAAWDWIKDAMGS